MHIVVGIATKGRPRVLAQTLKYIREQSLAPDRIFICHAADEDVQPKIADDSITYILSRPGGTVQRNRIIEESASSDLLIFLDDDFFPDRDYIIETRRAFANDSKIVAATGLVIADGIKGPGLSVEEAQHVLTTPRTMVRTGEIESVWSVYGCNMSFRVDALHQNNLRFDERLKMYSWQEDVDLSRLLSSFGTICKIHDARGVHLGTKLGRSSGIQLGYAQIANPIYLASKGSGYTWKYALIWVSKHIVVNLVKSFWSENYIDRRGRLKGNLYGVKDVVTGKLKPERVADL